MLCTSLAGVNLVFCNFFNFFASFWGKKKIEERRKKTWKETKIANFLKMFHCSIMVHGAQSLLVVRMTFSNVLSHKNVRKQHHFGVFLLYKTFPNVWTSSSNILTSVCDVKTSIMRSWKCPKRGHSIMTPYPAWVPNPRLYQLCFPTWATLLWMQAYVWSSKEQELIYFLKLTLCSYDSVLFKNRMKNFWVLCLLVIASAMLCDAGVIVPVTSDASSDAYLDRVSAHF